MFKVLRKNFKAFSLMFLSVVLGIFVSEYVYNHIESGNIETTATQDAGDASTQIRLGQAIKPN